MKKILISIRPQWCEKIVSGKKTIEVRKTAPKEVPFKCYIYMTQGAYKDLGLYSEGIYQNRMKVIGEFICDRVIEWKYLPDDVFPSWLRMYYIYADDGEKTCLSYREIEEYGKGKTLYGWHISDLKLYDKPKPIMQFYKPCPIKIKNCPVCELYSTYTGCCMNNIDRPPQSYMFVEEVQNDN